MKKDLEVKNERAPWFNHYISPSRFFDDFFDRDLSLFSGNSDLGAMAIDVDETPDKYVISADLPGVKKEDVTIECVGNQLSISAERKYATPEGGKNGHHERFYGSYQRAFTLPVGANGEKIDASFENGVLKVNIAKGETAKSKRIELR